MNSKEINILEGKIVSVLAKLAIPIMLTSLLQMTYNLVDMIWIGFLGSDALAAVGAAGMFNILTIGFAVMAKMGGQVYLGQSLGQKDYQSGIDYARHAIQLGILFALGVGIVSILFAQPLIAFFNFTNPMVIQDAVSYLQICCGLCIFSFMNNILTGLVTAIGNSALCFKVNAIGLLANLVLDPLLIFGLGPLKPLGVSGAAIATVGAQALVTFLFIYALKDELSIFTHIRLFTKMDLSKVKSICKVGYPSALDNAFYSIISMIIARMIASYGEGAVAVQKVGAQIESITWMVAQGYGMALNSFVAQNFGSGFIDRIHRGFRISLKLLIIWGICTTLILYFGQGPIMQLFFHEEDVLQIGYQYLAIISLSQLAMTMEYAFAGVFNGLAKTKTPGFISIFFTAIRVPIAYLLTMQIGLDGIWWTLTLTSIVKTIVLGTIYFIQSRKVTFFSIKRPTV